MFVERDPYAVLRVSPSDAWPSIRTAYRNLVRRFHADGTTPDRDRMVELNAAYECLEREHLRFRDEASRGVPMGPGVAASPGVPVGPGVPVRPGVPVGPVVSESPGAARARFVPSEGSLLGRMTSARRRDTPVVDFGQYAGWRIAEIAECDPRYLRWLSRHSSGIRYRTSIEQVLGSDPDIGRRAAILG